MKIHTASALLLLAAAPMFAQTTGVSHPENTFDDTDSMPVAVTPAPAKPSVAKPSAAIPVAVAPTAPQEKTLVASRVETPMPMADIPTRRDPDEGIVTYVPAGPNELPRGTVMTIRLNEMVNSTTAAPGSAFIGTLVSAIERDGRVVIPAGAEMHGTVEQVHSGRRISGVAQMRLQPTEVMLPDGSHYVIHAQVIDTDQRSSTRVTSSGMIVHTDHTRATLAILGLSAGSGAAAGAVFGGSTGAIVGAVAGVGVSTAHLLLQNHEARLPAEAKITFALTVPMQMTPLK